MMKFVKVTGVIAVLAVALVVSAIAVLKSRDFNEYRGLIAEQIKAATGRELVISGDLKLELSMQPSVTVEGVSLANAPWGSKPEMASIKRFEAKVKLMPLFSGDIEVVRVVLTGVDALIEISKDGDSNLDFSGSPDKSTTSSTGDGDGPSLPVIHAVEFRDVRLTFKDDRSGETVTLALDRMAVASASLDSPVNIDLAGTFNKRPVTVKGALGALRILIDGGAPWPVSLSFAGPGVSLKVEGGIDRPMAVAGLDLRVALDVGDPAAAAALAGVDLPKLPGLQVSGLLRDSKTGYVLSGVRGTAGSSDFSGNIGVDLAGTRPALTAVLTSRLIALDEWLVPGGPASTGESPRGDGRVFPDAPLPLDGLGAADADISLQVDKLTVNRLVAGDINVKLRLKGGILKIDPLRAAVAGGRVAATVDLDSASNPPRLALKVDGEGLDVGGLLNDMKVTDILSGAMNIKVAIKSRGASVRAIMAGLDGRFSVVGRNGRLNSKALEGISSGLLDVLPWAGREDTNRINCLIGSFDIIDGKANSRALVLDTVGITVIGRGTLNLADESIDMAVDTRARKASLAKLALPIEIGGTFAAPTFTPNIGKVLTGVAGSVGGMVKAPVAALGSLLGDDGEKAVDESDPCVQALAASSGTRAATNKQARKSPPPPERKKNEGIVDGVKNLGKGLTKSLGKLFGD